MPWLFGAQAFTRSPSPVARHLRDPRYVYTLAVADITTGAPIDPHLVGRRDERNVVIGAPQVTAGGPQQFTVIIDRRHPSFFDHDYDHVPEPLLMEALRQAAIATAHGSGGSEAVIRAITSAEVNFEGFAELDAAIHCLAGPLNRPGESGDLLV